jgi:hypothetical protein
VKNKKFTPRQKVRFCVPHSRGSAGSTFFSGWQYRAAPGIPTKPPRRLAVPRRAISASRALSRLVAPPRWLQGSKAGRLQSKIICCAAPRRAANS